jgi:hypothetical protein
MTWARLLDVEERQVLEDLICEEIDRGVEDRHRLLILNRLLEEVSYVEVTHDLSLVPSETPLTARRSGARNVAPPHLQTEFISAARLSMGQPEQDDVTPLIGRNVVLVFNDDHPQVQGVLTRVVNHPSGGPGGPIYLILDEERNRMYPLNAVQEIREA